MFRRYIVTAAAATLMAAPGSAGAQQQPGAEPVPQGQAAPADAMPGAGGMGSPDQDVDAIREGLTQPNPRVMEGAEARGEDDSGYGKSGYDYMRDRMERPGGHHGMGHGMTGRGGMGHGMMGHGMMGGRDMMGGLRMMMILMDTDGDGALSLEEVQAVHERFFRAIDTDGDGGVTAEEIRAFMRGDQQAADE
jgi:hypothetical protein